MILSEGWVYVLSNKSFKGQVKIGYSTVSSSNRAKELDTTGVPTPFKLEYEIKVKNCELLERKVHEHLRSKRVRKGREFFRIDIPSAISAIQELADEQKIEEVLNYKSPEEIRRLKAARKLHKEKVAREKKRKEKEQEYKSHVTKYLLFCTQNFSIEIEKICTFHLKRLKESTWALTKNRKFGRQRIEKFKQDFGHKNNVFISKFETYLMQNPDFFENYYGTAFHFTKHGEAVHTTNNRSIYKQYSRDNKFYRQNDITWDFRLNEKLKDGSELELLNFYKHFLSSFQLIITPGFSINNNMPRGKSPKLKKSIDKSDEVETKSERPSDRKFFSVKDLDEKKSVGKISFKNGDWYVGERVGKVRHGQGKHYYKDGRTVEGNFVKNYLKGNAILHDPSEGTFYGEIKFGRPDGEGEFVDLDGKKWIGVWRNGKRQGKFQTMHNGAIGFITYENGVPLN